MVTITFTASSGNEARLEVQAVEDGDETRIAVMVRWRNQATSEDNRECDEFFDRLIKNDDCEKVAVEDCRGGSIGEMRRKASAFLHFGDMNAGGNG